MRCAQAYLYPHGLQGVQRLVPEKAVAMPMHHGLQGAQRKAPQTAAALAR